MDPNAQLTGLQYAPVQHKLSPYDSPTKPGHDPRSQERQAQKDEVSHPFIHYLAQFVPGLVTQSPPLAGAHLPVPQDARASEALDQPDAGLQGPHLEPGKSKGLDPMSEALLAVPTSGPQALLPQAPVEPPKDEQALRVTALQPTALPPLIYAQVQRMQADNLTATQIRVQLDPPDLGKLDLAFTYAQQTVSVNVVAATQQAKDHLDAQLGAIRGILAEHNLQSGELKVVLGGKNGPQGGSTDRGGNGSGQAATAPAARRRKRPSLDEDLAIDVVLT